MNLALPVTPPDGLAQKESVESISLIQQKVVANPNTDKRCPIPHTQTDMRCRGTGCP